MSVTRRIVASAVFLLLIVDATHSISQSNITQSTMLARVEDDTITVYDLVHSAWTQHLLRKEPSRPSDERLRSLLEDLIFESLLTKEAVKMDLSQDWEFNVKERTAVSEAAARVFQDEEFLYRLNIDSAAVDSYFQEHIERFTVPRPQRHIRQITVFKKNYGIPDQYLDPIDTLYVGWDPKRKIDSLYQRLRAGEPFQVLAALYSEEPRARTLYGDWGWVSRQGLADTNFARIAFEQPLHRISQPIELPFGWVIVQCLGERDAGDTPFDGTVVSTIQNWLVQELGKDLAKRLVDSLIDVADIQYLDDAIRRPDTAIGQGTPLVIVNQLDTLRGADFFAQKNNTPQYQSQHVLTEDDRRTIINSVLRGLTLLSALREWGYLDRPEVQVVRRSMREQRGRDRIMVQLNRDLAPDSADLDAYYQSHLKEFTPERRHQVYLKTFDQADSAAAAAERWRGGEAPVNAQSQWINADDVPSAVWNRVASVPEGTIVGPVTAGSKSWVVQLARIAQPRPFRELKGSIISRIRADRYQAEIDKWVRDMSRKYVVERRLDVLDRLMLPSKAEATNEWFVDVDQASHENR